MVQRIDDVDSNVCFLTSPHMPDGGTRDTDQQLGQYRTPRRVGGVNGSPDRHRAALRPRGNVAQGRR